MSEKSQEHTQFNLGDQTSEVRFVETQQVKDGVSCDIYEFCEDSSKDLAIVTIEKGFKTPLQLVLSGEETIEIFARGKGQLCVWDKTDSPKTYSFDQDQQHEGVIVKVGEKMQWSADENSELIFYEVCTPPYQDGRFEDILE